MVCAGDGVSVLVMCGCAGDGVGSAVMVWGLL